MNSNHTSSAPSRDCSRALRSTACRHSYATSKHFSPDNAFTAFVLPLCQFLFWLTTIVCACSTYIDLFTQAIEKSNPSKQYLLLIIIGSYALLGTSALVLSFSRFMSIRHAHSLVPRLYVPISRQDLPKFVADHVDSCLGHSSSVLELCKPDAAQTDAQVYAPVVQEWGAIRSPLEGTHFRQAVIQSINLLAQRIAPMYPHLSFTDFESHTTTSNVSVSSTKPTLEQASWTRKRFQDVRAWMNRLTDARLVDKRLAKVFVETWERARWGGGSGGGSHEPFTVDQYLAFMKILAVILQQIPAASPNPSIPSKPSHAFGISALQPTTSIESPTPISPFVYNNAAASSRSIVHPQSVRLSLAKSSEFATSPSLPHPLEN